MDETTQDVNEQADETSEAEETETVLETLTGMEEILGTIEATLDIVHIQSHEIIDAVRETLTDFPAETADDLRKAIPAALRTAGKLSELHAALIAAGGHVAMARATIADLIGESRSPESSIEQKIEQVLSQLRSIGAIDGYEVIRQTETEATVETEVEVSEETDGEE